MSWSYCFLCGLIVFHAAVTTRSEDQYACDSDTLLPRRVVREIRSYEPIVDKIIDTVVYGDEQNVTYDELAKFVDTFGARPSGSKSLEDSIDYMFDMLRGQGLDFVHTENASVVNWQRGHEEAWITQPRLKRMDILGLGNSVSTPEGGITAPVLVVGCFEELEEKSSKAKGKIVVFNQEFVTYAKTLKYRVQGASAAAKAGAVAALVRSLTPMSINSPHTGYMTYDENTTRIPTAAITVEDAELLARLQERGSEPVVKLVMGAKSLPPAVSRNTIAELRGNSKPQEAKGKIVVFNQEYVSYHATVNYRVHGATEAAKAGAVAALVRSVTPFSINSPHTGYMEYSRKTPRIPTASITVEDAELLARLQDRGIQPVIKLVMGAKTLPPGLSRNTIAEIRGRTKPKEVVSVSGHLDSWDVGQGAMDDGAGAFISWRALAVLRRLGLRPRRTLRCILFTGEEQGITGATEYFQRHFARERHLLNAVMESDSGTFRPLGLAFSGSNKRARCIVAEVLRLFASINATLLTLGVSEPDLLPWIQQGVPALSLNAADERYFYFHHTEADTMSVLDRHELDLCTALWAAASYIFADLSIRLPR